jgi:uncharacterized protein YyaL (SSP411 family)
MGETVNKLANEKSAYLQHAAHQKINWYPWSDEAFEKAKQEDKPVFLSSGAIWCHWCHVMAKESFEDNEVALILNENFIAIKLDRDEMPDIDRRYQQAVAAMGFGGGWPLSIFLTSDRKPFYGGTYFPPGEGFGRPAFKTILMAITQLYSAKRDEVIESSEKILDMLKQKPMGTGELRESLIDEGTSIIMKSIDTLYGGFGKTPKFPMSGAIEFLLGRYFFSRDEVIGAALRKTLTFMAKGGFHDQLAGGFHRYSTDQAWIIPHFEKMADDNAWLLRNYVDAYSLFGDPYFKEAAEGIISFTRGELSHPDGGFYASQDADVTPDDEGGYFTWTDEDFRKLLDDEEYKVLAAYFLHDRGMMHHDPAKRVLYLDKSPEDVAKMMEMDVETVNGIIERGKKKLLAARETRIKPIIDTALYSSLNGMYISAFLKAYRVLKDEEMKGFALKSLEKILTINTDDDNLLHTPGVKGLLDDHIHLIDALVSAYEVTGVESYLGNADLLMSRSIELFWDEDEGGFFDTDEEVLGTRLKGIEDIPQPSANSIAIILLLKLAFMRDKAEYRTFAEKALKVFSSWGQAMGVHGGYYFSALEMYYNGLELTVSAPLDSELSRIALSTFRPCSSIQYKADEGHVAPCLRNVCYEPLKDPETLKKFLATPK